MKVSLRKGISYGATSGVITSLGLLIGLYSTQASKSIILAGLLTIAFADAFSDGLGIHISEESENHHSRRSIWESTCATIVAKTLLGLTFIAPLIVLSLNLAVFIDILWGVGVLALISFKIAQRNKESVKSVLLEHLGIGFFVIVTSYFIGRMINQIVL